MNLNIESNNPIFKEVLKNHEGWWISDVIYDLWIEGINNIEVSLCLKYQGFLK